MRQLNENQIFQYNGSPITFQKGDSVMVMPQKWQSRLVN
jgi:hypothetical protein|nr:MAG TPA: cupin domain protein [Caudoviricetes sp.]